MGSIIIIFRGIFYPIQAKGDNMAIRVLFLGKSQKYVMKITNTDWIVAGVLTVSGLKFFPMVTLESNEEAIYPRDELLTEANAFLKAFGRDQKFLQYHYSFEIAPPGGLPKSRGSGSVSGFKINDKYFCIVAGMGECYLLELGSKSNKINDVSRRVDVRDRKCIETDDWGVIKIFRRKKKVTWPEVLPPLIEFLRNLPDSEVHVRVEENQPSIMDLVRAYERGFGEDDWAEEELEKRGNEAKTVLLEKLKDPGMTKYYESIAMLLLTCFPSFESRKAVEQLIEQETNERAKTVYMALLQATAQRPKG